MVLEKDKKLSAKIVVSDQNVADDSDNSGEIQKQHSFDIDPMHRGSNQEEGKKVFKASTKKKMQLTFEKIFIKTVPKQRKCCKGSEEPAKSKVILNGVSGTILPGEFLSIIGASGITLINDVYLFRCWKDYFTELPIW